MSEVSLFLAVRNLTKRFSGRVVLDDLDLDVWSSEVVLLSGTNGSGKTTLLRAIVGLTRYRGEVLLGGEPLGRSARDRAGIGYLPQSPGLPAWATGGEVLDLFAALRGVDGLPEELPAGFLPPLGRVLGQLSGGQRQRVAIAVALLGSPALLLLDEPAANLDDDGRADLAEVLAAVRERGGAVLVASPSPGDLAGVPDRVVRLCHGQADRSAARTHPSGADRQVSNVVAFREVAT